MRKETEILYPEERKDGGEIHSFDVFDTLIARQTSTPLAVWDILGAYVKEAPECEGLSSFVKENFSSLRQQIEILVKFRAGRIQQREDVTLSDIYTAFGENEGFGQRMQGILCALERKVEADLLRPVLRNINRVKSLVQAGKRVVIISDMYLEEGTIRRILTKIDPVFEPLPMYISSKYGAAKYTGKIYQIAWEKEGKPRRWFHCGDDPLRDNAVPAKFGIQCDLYRGGVMLPFEKDIDALFGHCRYHQLAVGTARLLRSEGVHSIAYEVGCSLGGPMLYAYVTWILQECQKRDIRRLYFIARDGYVPKKIADDIITQDWLPVETKYVYCSHEIWNLAALTEDEGDFQRLVYSMNPQNITSAADFALFLKVPFDEMIRFFPEEYRGALSREKLAQLLAFLDTDRSFRK